MRECAEFVAQMPLNEQGIARLKRMGIKTEGKDITAMMGLVYGQFASAMNGNKNSAEFIQNLLDSKANDESSASSFIDALNGQSDALFKGLEDGEVEE